MAKRFPLEIVIGAIDKFSSTFATLGSKLDRIGAKADQMGKVLSTRLSAPLAALGLLSLKKAANFETYRTALETATGSTEAAAKEFANLQNFAATTPFQLEEVVQAFLKLKNLGLDPSQEALTAYGNTSGAMGKSLMQMIEAVADASTLEFERLKEFGIRAKQQGNFVTFTFQGVKTKVRKDASEIEKYLRQLGMVNFAGGMDKQSKTLAGAFSNLQDSIASSMDRIGTKIAQIFNLNDNFRKLGDSIGRMTDAFDALDPIAQKFLVFGALAAIVIGPLILIFGQLAMAIAFLATPIGAAILGLTVIGGMAAYLGFQLAKLSDMAGGMGNAFLILGGIILDVLVSPLTGLAKLIERIWGLFGNPPAGLSKLANFSFGQMAADRAQGQIDAQEPVLRPLLNAETSLRRQAAISAPAAQANAGKADISVVFQNPPAGMRTSVKENTGTSVTVDQGISMAGAY